jgi:ferritin-like metal-binding protein YciE
MADGWTLRDVFVDELRDAYDAEKQLTAVLPRMMKAATSPGLRTIFEDNLEQARGHLLGLEHVFDSLDERAPGKHSEGMAGIVNEGKAFLHGSLDKVTRDACLIARGRQAQHYAMAAYLTLVSWARAMSFNEVGDLLQQMLDQERATERALAALAEGGINQKAADVAYPASDGDDIEVPVTARDTTSRR